MIFRTYGAGRDAEYAKKINIFFKTLTPLYDTGLNKSLYINESICYINPV